MKVGLIDIDSKIPNLALMKLSTYHKQQGYEVSLNDFLADRLYCSVIFQKNRSQVEKLLQLYPHMIVGGTGWDLSVKLPPEVHSCKPDYDLYTKEFIYKRILGGIATKESKLKKAEVIVNAGMGFTSRGCIRNCGFCVVPKAEGEFRQENEIKDLLNPRSNTLILFDNNLTADPNALEKLKEIKERDLRVDITQGIDVRLLTPEIARALSEVKHLRSIHYAWDLMNFERPVLEGIKVLLQHVKAWKHLCFILVGFNTTFEEDRYRFTRLMELGIKPYVMVYNDKPDVRLKNFEAWVNSRKHTVCTFEEFEPWIKAQRKLSLNQTEIFTA